MCKTGVLVYFWNEKGSVNIIDIYITILKIVITKSIQKSNKYIRKEIMKVYYI